MYIFCLNTVYGNLMTFFLSMPRKHKQLLSYFIFGDVQKTDEGNLSCVVYEKFWKNKTKVRGDLLAMKSVPIQLRGR